MHDKKVLNQVIANEQINKEKDTQIPLSFQQHMPFLNLKQN
jgi:hypothetical protein